MKRAQHAAPNPKLEWWDYSDIPGGGNKKIKGPAHMAEGGHHPRKAPNPQPLLRADIYGIASIYSSAATWSFPHLTHMGLPWMHISETDGFLPFEFSRLTVVHIHDHLTRVGLPMG